MDPSIMATTTTTALSSLLATAIASSTTASALSLVATTTASPMSGGSQPVEDDGECKLLGPFSIFIQGALGFLALLSLVYKRWRERPQRPVKIWGFDVSKQVVGSILLHLANLLMSLLSSGALTVSPSGTNGANPCSFYLLNLAIDTTIGIPILIIFLRVLTIGALKTPFGSPPESIKSGNYGDPPKTKWWLKQSLIYFLGLLGMKICVFFFFNICPWIINVGDWALRWTDGNEGLQIFFVMLLFPVIMNAMQYYIIDSFIKQNAESGHEPIPTEDVDEVDDETHQFALDRDSAFDSDAEEEDMKKAPDVTSDSSAKLRISSENKNRETDAGGSSNSVDLPDSQVTKQ